MEEQPQQSQQQWQSVIGVPCRMVGHVVRKVILRPQSPLIDKIDSGEPVPLEQLSMPLYVVLPACEVPHEIPAVHVPYLVPEKEPQVLGKCGAYNQLRLPVNGNPHLPATDHAPPFILTNVPVAAVAPHPGEQARKLRVVFGLYPGGCLRIAAVLPYILHPPLADIQLGGGIVLAVEERTGTVLFPGKVGD